MSHGRAVFVAAALLSAACTPADDGKVAPAASHFAPAFARYLVSYGGTRSGTVEIDMARRSLCSQGHAPWAKAGHVHLRAPGAPDPVVLTLFEPPRENRRSVCVEDVGPDVLTEILAQPEGYYVDLHEAQRGGREVRGKLGARMPEFEGLEVDVPNPLFVRGGERFEFPVAARDADGRINGLLVRFGDGTVRGGLPFDLVCAAIAGKEPAEGPSSLAETFEHAYRRAGEYTVTVEATSGGCFTSVEESRTEMTITVEGNARTSNGPFEPRAKIGHGYYTRGVRDVLVSDVGGHDADGWVYWMRVDWGDGSPPAVFERGFSRCHAGRGWPEGWFSDRLRHRYARAGEYRVSVKVRSAGCDGEAVQTDRSARVLEYPPVQGS
jgi:hypothetical protein